MGNESVHKFLVKKPAVNDHRGLSICIYTQALYQGAVILMHRALKMFSRHAGLTKYL